MQDRVSKSKNRIWNKIGERVRRGFELQVAAGAMPGVSVFRVTGSIPQIPTQVQPIWPGAAQYPYLTDAETLVITSSSALDTYDGTGARSIRVLGLDANYELQMEDITLQGLNSAYSTGDYVRLLDASVLTAGTTNGAAGIIDIQSQPASAVLGYIEPTINTLQNGIFTVPSNCNAYLMDFGFGLQGSVNQDVFCEVRYNMPFDVPPQEKPWLLLHPADIHLDDYHSIDSIPYFFPPKTDVEFAAVSGQQVLNITGRTHATFLLVDTQFEWERLVDSEETHRVYNIKDDVN